jgi:predicted negative regulator of RcsB-dependent stress response
VETFNDDDQAQQLKDWWKQNWQPVLLGLGLSIGGVLGWNSWQAHKAGQAELASGHFEQVRLSLAAGNLEAANDAQQNLIDEFSSSAYAAQGAMSLAQHYVEANDYASAAAHLQWAAAEADDEKLAHIATLRLARLHWAQGENETALTFLTGSNQGAFASLYAELRGDILLSQGDVDAARRAYQDALALSQADDFAAAAGVGRADLQSKLDDLAPAAPATDSAAADL